MPFIPQNVPLTVGREYDVHGLTTYNGTTFFQIVDDNRYPSWNPSWLFDVIDRDVPTDWICNVFDSGHLVLGPEFVAKDLESYVDMVELSSDQVDRFWNRLGSLKASTVADP
jgi:hypothetical protein